MKKKLNLKIIFCSDAIISSGNSVAGGEDIAIRTDLNNCPIIPGATLKGLLRESLTNLLCWTGNENAAEILKALLGEQGRDYSGDKNRIIFSDFKTELTLDRCTEIRCFTALEDDMVAEGSLRMARVLKSGLCFEGFLLCQAEYIELITEALRLIKNIGLLRNRGFGKVNIQVTEQALSNNSEKIKKADRISYRIKLETSVFVPWIAQSGTGSEDRNFTETRNLITGSMIRGMVMSELSANKREWFEQNKSILLSEKLRFSDAFPVIEDKRMLPTPSGFYENKAQTEFCHLFSSKKIGSIQKNAGDVIAGHKRAKTGAFCLIDGEKIKTFTPQIEQSMRIDRNADRDKNVFTNRVISPNTVWEGYIDLDIPEMAEQIAEVFGDWISIGADRFAGHGLCKVEKLQAVSEQSYMMYEQADEIPEKITMQLLSPCTMMKNGEPIGLDEQQLAELLGVEKVEIALCASSTTESYGYNRMWSCTYPSMVMYERGSLFQLKCTPAPSWEKLEQLQRNGIGIRRAEGFGGVLFVKQIEGICSHESIGNTDEQKIQQAEWKNKRRARAKWLMENKLPIGSGKYKLSNSQLGTIQSYVQNAAANGGDTHELEEFLVYNIERSPEYAKRFEAVSRAIYSVLGDESISQIVPQNTRIERLNLISEWIDLSRKAADR